MEEKQETNKQQIDNNNNNLETNNIVEQEKSSSKAWIIIPIAILIVLIIIIGIVGTIGYFILNSPKCGDNHCDLDEDTTNCNEDCPNCNDSNICTEDTFDYNTQECINENIIPCCGNNKCEQEEDFFSCSKDCEMTIELSSALHEVIPSGNKVIDVLNITNKIKIRENDYINKNFHAQIPFQHNKSEFNNTINSHDKIKLTFNLPQDIYSIISEKEVSLEVVLSCGDYGEVFINSENQFGEMDQLERINCEEKWTEITVNKKITPIKSKITATIERTGGTGSVKIDYTRLIIK